ncbi:PREDICTED: uncharacterized protein C11orf52 homolog [Elephantulus edwardii]|uniref:uncharacterized protein C11orf52 homolog n=1 Tax=Elephantulus edwardii TaxID=28737 RepID=UPI0003F06EFB|nr:PREDICTED: uncharacterized protein C11orf52 homolog [Elephantulus edwardii]
MVQSPHQLNKDTDQGSHARWVLKQQKIQKKQTGTQGLEPPAHTYERVLEQLESRKRHQSCKSEENSLHYADIQVCSPAQSRSSQEVKHQQLANATEYAVLRFPEATRRRYDSKNGTPV